MGATRNLEDKPSYPTDSTVSFDGEGYVCTTGSDGPDSVAKAKNNDVFVGINTISTKSPDDRSIYEGDPIALHQEGEVNVLCAAGSNYQLGDPVYMSDTAGIADKNSDSNADGTADTRIGTVAESTDLTGASGPRLVPVNITGYF